MFVFVSLKMGLLGILVAVVKEVALESLETAPGND